MQSLKDRLVAITQGLDPAFEHWVNRIKLS